MDRDGVRPMRRDPHIADHAPGDRTTVAQEGFNRTYCVLLCMLDAAFDGRPETLGEAVGVMYQLKSQAQALMQIPTEDGREQLARRSSTSLPRIGADEPRRTWVRTHLRCRSRRPCSYRDRGSGLRAAIELAERGIDVLAVGKRPKADAHTTLAAGGINAALATMDPEDTWQQHAADTLKESYLLANPHTVQIVTEGAAGASRPRTVWHALRPRAGRQDLAALLRRAHVPPHRLRRRLHRAGDPAHPRQPRRAAADPDPRHRLHHQAPGPRQRRLRCVRFRPATTAPATSSTPTR